MTETREKEWNDLCPDGAIRYYEGDDPNGFAAEMREHFGFDPTETWVDDKAWVDSSGVERRWRTNWDEHRSFFIPAGLVGAIYGNYSYPLGS